MQKIKGYSVLDLIRQARRQQGSPPRKYWHELLMDMELDAAAFGDSVNGDTQGARAQGIVDREGEATPLRWGPRV